MGLVRRLRSGNEEVNGGDGAFTIEMRLLEGTALVADAFTAIVLMAGLA